MTRPDDRRWYGLCPTQLEGITTDGRPFYFRSRDGWTLRVGQVGDIPNYSAWSAHGVLVADGVEDIEDPQMVDELVDRHLGKGWRHVRYEEQLFNQGCARCGETFRSDGANMCTDCLTAVIRKPHV